MAMTIEAPPPPAAVVDFRAFVQVLARRKALVLAIAGICLLAALAVALMMTPRYTSEIKILADPRGLQILPNDLNPNTASTDVTFAVVDSQVQLLTSTELLSKVIDKLKLADDPEFNAGSSALPGPAPSGMEAKNWAALRTLRKQIDVRRPDRTFVLTVSVWSKSSAEKSRQIAEAIGQAYLELQAQNQADVAKRTANALDAQLETLHKNLTRSENELEVYRVQNNLVGGNGRLLTERELTDLTNQLSAQRIRTSELKARMESLNRRNVGNGEIDTIAEALQSPTLNDLRARYAEAKKAEAESQVSLGPRHPAVINAHVQVRQLQDLIRNELARIQRSLVTEYERAKAVESALNQQIISARQFAASGSPPLLKLRALENDVAAQRSVFEAMQKRAKEVREAAALDHTNARIISPAALQPPGYVVPRTLIVAGGLIFGLLAGVFAAAFLNQVDTRVRTASDLFKRTQLFNLATLPRKAVMAAGSGPPRKELLEKAGLAGLREIFDEIVKKSPGAVLVVSADQPPASGALVLSLAAQMAQEGRGAWAVDATRTRYITRTCKLEGRPGVAEAGSLPLSLLKAEVSGVNVIPAGARTAAPIGSALSPSSPLLAGNDIVFMDGGTLTDGDYAALLDLAGVVLIVVTAGQGGIDRVAEAAQAINAQRNRLVASVLLT